MDHEAAWRLRVGRMDVELRELVRQHERGAAKLQLDVADAPARLDEAELLGGAEDVAAEVHRLPRGLCAQIATERMYCHSAPPSLNQRHHLQYDLERAGSGQSVVSSLTLGAVLTIKKKMKCKY